MKTILSALGVLALSAGIATAGSSDHGQRYHSKAGDLSLFGQVEGGNATQSLDLRGASGFTQSVDRGASDDYQSRAGDLSLFGRVGGGAVADGEIVKERTYK